MKFVLRQGSREVELPLGRFVIGRAESCQLPLEDPLVSRHHAAVDVTGQGATLRDLESRNGVRLNGTRITAPMALSLGDKIGIGGVELLFGQQSDKSAQTLVQIPAQRGSAFGLIGMLAEKALGLGRGEEAERLLGPQIEELLEDVERACELALRIAPLTGNSTWVSTVFRFYRSMGRLPPSSLVDELYAVPHKVKVPSRDELRAYLAALRDGTAALNPAERFLFGRLEGLERSLG